MSVTMDLIYFWWTDDYVNMQLKPEPTFVLFLQMATVASALIVLVTILKLGSLFQELPEVQLLQLKCSVDLQ